MALANSAHPGAPSSAAASARVRATAAAVPRNRQRRWATSTIPGTTGNTLNAMHTTQRAAAAARRRGSRSTAVMPPTTDRNSRGVVWPRVTTLSVSGVNRSAVTTSALPACRLRCASRRHRMVMPATRAPADTSRIAAMPTAPLNAAAPMTIGSDNGELTNATWTSSQLWPGGVSSQERSANAGPSS